MPLINNTLDVSKFNNILVIESIDDFKFLSKTYLSKIDCVLTTEPECYWLCKAQDVPVISLDEFASMREIEAKIGECSYLWVQDLCHRQDSVLEYAHFEIKKMLDPFIIYHCYLDLIERWAHDAKFHIFLIGSSELKDRYFSEDARILSSLIHERLKNVQVVNKVKTKVFDAQSLKSFGKFCIHAAVLALQVCRAQIFQGPIVARGVLARGFDQTLDELNANNKLYLFDTTNAFILSERIASLFKGGLNTDRLDDDIIRILDEKKLNYRSVRSALSLKLRALKIEKNIFLTLLRLIPDRKLRYFISMKTSSFCERVMCNHVKDLGLRVITFTHLAEGYYKNEIVEFIDYICTDIKIIPAPKAIQNEIAAKYPLCKIVTGMNPLYKNASKLSTKNGSGTIFVLYTYPKANFVLAHYRALSVEQFKIHCEWIRRHKNAGNSFIDFRLYPGQSQQEYIVKQVCEFYDIEARFHKGDFQEVISEFRHIIMDNFCTSFAEAFCMNKDITVVDTVFEVNDGLAGVAAEIDEFKINDSASYRCYHFSNNSVDYNHFKRNYFLSKNNTKLEEVIGFG